MAQELAQLHGVDIKVAEAAVKRRIDAGDTSAEARHGRDMYDETFGTGTRRAERDFAQKAMGEQHKLQQRLDRLTEKIDSLRKAGHQDGSEELRQLLDQADFARHDLEHSREIYFGLAEEIDARRAGFSVEAAFDRIVDAQTHLNMAKLRVQRVLERLEKLPADDEVAKFEQVRRLFVAILREHDELGNLAALLPKPAGSTR
jgi:hypothetical protein